MPSNAAALALLTAPIRLRPFDLGLVAAYLVGITLFGLSFRKRKGAGPGAAADSKDKSLKSYFLADNTIPWWAIALSIVSAETSTLTIISIPGVAFAGDFGFLQIVLGYMLGRVVVAGLFLPRYFAGEMLTAYQLIDRRFGPTLHKVTAGLFLLTRAAAEGVRVFAVSIVVGIAIGTRDILSIAIISALTLLYTFEGGMAAGGVDGRCPDGDLHRRNLGGDPYAGLTCDWRVESNPHRGCGCRQIPHVQLRAEPDDDVYVLGRCARRHVPDDGEPWDGSVDGAAAAGGAEPARVAAGAAEFGRGDLFAVRVFFC